MDGVLEHHQAEVDGQIVARVVTVASTPNRIRSRLFRRASLQSAGAIERIGTTSSPRSPLPLRALGRGIRMLIGDTGRNGLEMRVSMRILGIRKEMRRLLLEGRLPLESHRLLKVCIRPAALPLAGVNRGLFYSCASVDSARLGFHDRRRVCAGTRCFELDGYEYIGQGRSRTGLPAYVQ